MPSVQIKNVPDGTHAVLRERACAQHQSLQEFLLQMLIEQADRPTVDEVLVRAEARLAATPDVGITSMEIVEIIRADRDRR